MQNTFDDYCPLAYRTRRASSRFRIAKTEPTVILQQEEGLFKQQNGFFRRQIFIVLESQNQDGQEGEHSDRPEKQDILNQQQRMALMDENLDPRSNQQQSSQNLPERKGRFTPEQQRIITDSVGQFLAVNQISFNDFIILLNQKNVINKVLKKNNFFNSIASKLPGRSIFSCYRFIKRLFPNTNRKGKWEPEQQKKLISLVQSYGHSWIDIGKQLGRPSDNVYDKYRSMGSQNAKKRLKCHWCLKQYVKLLLQVNSRVKDKFVDEAIKGELSEEQDHNVRQTLCQKQNKYNTAHQQNHFLQVAMKYVNQNIRRVDIDHVSWSAIAGKIKKRSMIDCKNKFLQLFQFAIKNYEFDDLKIIAFIQEQKLKEQFQVDWQRWPSQAISMQQAKNRFLVLKKAILNRVTKQFHQIIHELKLKILRKQYKD